MVELKKVKLNWLHFLGTFGRNLVHQKPYLQQHVSETVFQWYLINNNIIHGSGLALMLYCNELRKKICDN